VHALTDGQDTLVNPLKPRPTTLGERISDQREPFQRSARAADARPFAENFEPTATHIVAEAHDTADNLGPALEPKLVTTLGVCCRDQRCPFHRSTKDRVLFIDNSV
jgi:hypothetical protein